MAARRLVLKVTAGADEPERCLQGLTVASVAAMSGISVSLWLTGEAVWLVAGRDLEIPESPAASELLAAVLEVGGGVTVCTQCAARRGLVEQDLRDGVVLAGATSFVAQALADGVQALVY